MLGPRRRRRSSDDSTDLEGSSSMEALSTGSAESVTKHYQETPQENPETVSESSSICTRVMPLTDASEVLSDVSPSHPPTKTVLLHKIQSTVAVVLLDKIKITKPVSPWAQSSLQMLSEMQCDHLMVSIPLWRVSRYRDRIETTQSASSADETTAGLREWPPILDPNGDSEDDEMSEESSQLQREECFAPDSEVVTINEDGTSSDLEEPIVTTLSAYTNTELPVQALIVPECSYFGADDDDHLQPIERVMAPVVDHEPPPSEHFPLSTADDPASIKHPQPKHHRVGRERGKGKRRKSSAGSGVESQSNKEQCHVFGSPQCLSESAQESIPCLPGSAAMETTPRPPQELPCAADLLQGGGCLSPNLPQPSTVEQQPTTSVSECPKVEPITGEPAEVRPSNEESSIQVKREVFHADFKSTERYTFDVPLEPPDCARLVPVVYHFQKPPGAALRLQEWREAERKRIRAERKRSREASWYPGSSGSSRVSLPATNGGGSLLSVSAIKPEPFDTDSCNSRELVRPPQDMETSSPCASASTGTEETSSAVQPAPRCACLPPTPPEQVGEQSLATRDLSVKELLSKFTMGNDEADEEEKESPDAVMGACGLRTSTEGDNSEVLTWLQGGDKTDVSCGGDGKVASSSSVGLDLLTPSTLESLPTGADSTQTDTAGIGNNVFLSCQGDGTTSESPLLAQQIQDMEDVRMPGDGGSGAFSRGDREPEKEDCRCPVVGQMAVTAADKRKGDRALLKQARKKKLGRPKKSGKSQTPLKLGRGKKTVGMAGSSSCHRSSLTAQKRTQKVGDEQCDAFTNVRDREPVMEGDREPVMEGDREPVMEGDREPVMEGDREPVMEGDREPVMEGDREPVMEGDREPVMEGDREPVMEGDREPVMEDDRQPVMEGGRSMQAVEQKYTTAADVTTESCAELQQVKKKKVGRPRKIDKKKTALEQRGSEQRKNAARKSSASSCASALLAHESVAESPVPAQVTSEGMGNTPGEEGPAATTAAEGDRELSRDDYNIQPDATTADKPEGSCTEVPQVKKKVGRPRKVDKSPPLSPVHIVRQQDGIIQSRKRARNANETASPAKRSRKLSPLIPEKELTATTEDNRGTSPARGEIQSPKQKQSKRRSASLLAAEGNHGPLEAVNLTNPLSSTPVPDDKPVTVPDTVREPPVMGKKKGRKIKLQSVKKMVHHEPSMSLLNDSADSSQTAPAVVQFAVRPSSSADVQPGSAPTADVPFTFNLEKNQERLSGSLKMRASSGMQPPASAPLSFSFVLPQSKDKVVNAVSRPDGTWASNFESPPPPLPQTPSTSISSFRPSQFGSSGDMAVDVQEGMARKPEEGDLLELHPLGDVDFDEVTLLGDNPKVSAGEFAGRPSKAMNFALKTEPMMDRPARLKLPVNVNRGRGSPQLHSHIALQKSNLRVRAWVEDIGREPPIPPPQQVLQTADERYRPEEDEEFVSASIVNGPAVMVTYSELSNRPPSNQHGPPPAAPEPRVRGNGSDIPPSSSYRRWARHCRYFLLGMPCLRNSCHYLHRTRLELPIEVKHHLEMVERVGPLVDKDKSLLTDDVVVMLNHILEAFCNEDLASVCRLRAELQEKRIELNCQFYEMFLTAVANSKVIPDELLHLAELTFDHLQNVNWRQEDFQMLDYENIIRCHLTRNDVQRVCDYLAMMPERGYMPRVETIELFIVAVEQAHTADPEANASIVKRALNLAVKYVNHMPNIMNQFFPMLLKAPQVFVAEVKLLLQCVMENGLYAMELENIVPVIDLCLCHSWVVELEHITSHCHFISLLPADTVQAVLRAVSSGRMPVNIGTYFVGKLSEAQRNHVDPQTWVGLLEHFCQYGKANMVVKVQQICKELEVTIPDMVLWEVLNYFVRVHNVSAAAEVFFQLKELSPSFFNARCVSSMFKTLKETKDYQSLYRTLKKLLEHKMTGHLQELNPVFQWLLDNNLVKEICCIVNLIHSCRSSVKLPPRPFLEQAEKKLIEWGKNNEALEQVAEMLGRPRPTAAVTPQEVVPPPPSIPPPPPSVPRPPQVTSPSTAVVPNAIPTHPKQERLAVIEGILSEGEWDVAAVMIARMETLPKQLALIVFQALVQLTCSSEKLSSGLARFMEGLQRPQSTAHPTQEAWARALRDLVAQVGLSLVVHCCSTFQWTSGFAALSCLHSNGIYCADLFSHVPVITRTTEKYASEGSRMLAAVKICVEVSTHTAINVLRGCNWTPLDINDEEGLRLAKSTIPPLVHHHMNKGEHGAAQDLLDHMGRYLDEELAEQLYCLLLGNFLSAKELEKACEVAILLLKQWKRVHKGKLVKLLICLRSANMLKKKDEVLQLALEAGVLQKIGCGKGKNDGQFAKGMTKEEIALLLELHLEDLCLLHMKLKDVSLTFPDIDTLHKSLDYFSNFPTPPLQGCKVNDFLDPPMVSIPAHAIVAWRKANIDKATWGSKGYKQQQNFRSPPTPKKQWADGGKGKGKMRQQGAGRPNNWTHLSPPSRLPHTVPTQSTPLQSSTETSLHFNAHRKGVGQPLTEQPPSGRRLKETGQSPPEMTSPEHSNSTAHQQSVHTSGETPQSWKTEWRMAVSGEVHAIVHPFRFTKFTSQDHRMYFEQTAAQNYSMLVEKREAGPWRRLTAAHKQELENFMARILSKFDVYTAEVADSLNL